MNQRISYHHGDLRQALIQGGLAILEARGQSDLSLRALADEVGVSPAAPYRHFADKTALMGALAATGFGRLHETLADLYTGANAALSPPERLRLMMARYVDLARQHPALYHLMFSRHGYQLKSEDCQREGQAAFELLVRAVAEAQGAGYRPTMPLADLAVALWAQIHGWASFYIDGLIPPQFEPADWLTASATLLDLPN